MPVGSVYEVFDAPIDFALEFIFVTKAPTFPAVAIAKACAATDTWMEISTWHSHLTTEEIKIAATEDVKFIVSSDAHSPKRVGSFEGGVKRALEAGLDMERLVNIEVK